MSSSPTLSSASSSVTGTPAGLRRIAVFALRVYQTVLSPWLGPACRYAPSCSEYAVEAIERHGVLRGFWLALRRVTRCNPFGGSGYDPVP